MVVPDSVFASFPLIFETVCLTGVEDVVTWVKFPVASVPSLGVLVSDPNAKFSKGELSC